MSAGTIDFETDCGFGFIRTDGGNDLRFPRAENPRLP